MSPIQVVLLAALALAVYVTGRRVRQQVIGRGAGLLWMVLWISAAVAIARPETTSYVARVFGVGRGVDFVLYASVISLFFLVFRLYVALDRFERRITELVRREALRELPERRDAR